MLRTCESCGHKVSSNAKVCPKCGRAPKRVSERQATGGTFACRKCGTELPLYQHRGSEVRQGGAYAHVSGNTVSFGREIYRVYVHRPCPECGEPKPLKAYSETLPGKFHAGLLQLIVFVTVLICFYYCVTLFRTAAALVTKFDYQPLLNLPHGLVAILLATAVLIPSFRFAEQGTAHARWWIVALPLALVPLLYAFGYR
jgi:predicted RNA-binding Zn-ribbon protein involved in translation (DUF1610 family)